MTDHIATRHKLKAIKLKSDFLELIDKIILSEDERKILIKHYIENKNFAFIGDELGYTEQAVIRKHCLILDKLKDVV